MILNISHLSEKLHVSKENLRYHLFLLEFGKLIRIIRNYRPSVFAESRKMPKIYPYHPSMSYAYYDDINVDRAIENLVMHKLEVEHYFHERNREVDFLKIDGEKILPIEVKNRKNPSREDLKSLIWFMKRFNIDTSWVVYPGGDRIEKINDLTFHYRSIYRILYDDIY